MDNLYTTEFDSQLRKVEKINFLPWIGKNYAQQNKKILVVGESHASWGVPQNQMHAKPGDPFGDVRDWAMDRIKAHADGKYESNKRHFRFPFAIDGLLTAGVKFSASDTLKKMTPDSLQSLWSNIASTNIIQNFNADTSKWQEIQRGIKVINNICEIICPTHILILAKVKHQANRNTWHYINKARPNYLQTQHPTAHGGYWYNLNANKYREILDSWNIY